MIYAVLKDGTRRLLDQAQIAMFVWTDADEEEHTYHLADVEKLVLIEPTPLVRPGLMGAHPVVGMAFRDLSDLTVEVPVPAEVADGLGDGLKQAAADAVKLAESAQEIAHRGEVAVAQSMADVARAFGVAPRPRPGGNGSA